MTGNVTIDEQISKQLKNYRKAILGFFLATIICFAIFLLIDFMDQKNRKNFTSIRNQETTDVYSKSSVNLMLDYFATYEEDGQVTKRYYFLYDNEKWFIAAIKPSEADSLKEIYDWSYSEDDNAKEPEPVEIEGMSKTIPNDLKELAIEMFNKDLDADIVNSDNFHEYFGVLYLDTTESNNSISILFFTFAIIFLVADIAVIIFYFRTTKKFKTARKKLSEEEWLEIVNQIDDDETVRIENTNLFLLKEKILDLTNDMVLLPYDSILWVYPMEQKTRGILIEKTIYAYDKNFKLHTLATLSRLHIKEFDEMYNAFIQKLPNAMHGYTTEHNDKFQEMKKENKKKQKDKKREKKAKGV